MRCRQPSLGNSAILLVFFFVALTTAQTLKPPTPTGTPYSASDLHPGPAWFIDVAPQAGLKMENVNGGVDTKKYIIETTGSGVAIVDYDNDGWPDIFLVNGTTLDETKEKSTKPTSHLFHNKRNGTFEEVAETAGVAGNGKEGGTCFTSVDYDRGGKLDLLVSNYVLIG